METIGTAGIIFLLTLLATFGAAFFARHHSKHDQEDGLSGRNLNRWLVGLSAGTTANSGFIVTAAVGLGYSYGVQWLMLPVSWLIGDLIFWRFFPARINAFGHKCRATTLSEVLKAGLSGRMSNVVSVLAAVVIVVCLAGYTSAQWLAGEKFLAGAFHLPNYAALGLFAFMIVSYSAIGGFRGSVYTDTLQAIIRVLGTIIAVVAVARLAYAHPDHFSENLRMAGENFLIPFANGGLGLALGFVGGFAAAAVGFGLGQPQVVSRYLAGSSPAETGSAKWIYIGFVQFTWISMTLFGVLLRGVMPGLPDPETGLSAFFQQNINAVATGIIVADVFATIASTSNGLLVSMTQAIVHDLAPGLSTPGKKPPFALITLGIGVVTMLISLTIDGSVVGMALSSVSMMGAGLAPAMMIKVLGWRHDAGSITCAMLGGLLAAIAWKAGGLDATLNEAGIGMLVGLLLNRGVVSIGKIRNENDRNYRLGR